MSDNLRLKKKKPEPKIEASSGITGDLPLRPGNIILTDQERKDLKVLGYEVGQAIPGNLPELLQRARELQQGENAVLTDLQEEIERVSKTTSKLKVPKPVNLEDLPEEKQQELRAAMAKAQESIESAELQRHIQNQQSQFMAGLSPQLRELITNTQSSSQFLAAQKENTPASNPLLSTPTKPNSATESTSSYVPAANEKQTLTPDEQKSQFCPHCQTDITKPPEVEPTDSDIFDYVQSIIGKKPFLKAFNYLKGRWRVVFRSLSVTGDELVSRQLQRDAKEGKFLTPLDILQQEMLYRMCLGIYNLTIQNTGTAADTTYFSKEIDEYLAAYPDTEKDPALPAILKAIQTNDTLCNELSYRMLVNSWRKFNDLLNLLTLRAQDPNFCETIDN